MVAALLAIFGVPLSSLVLWFDPVSIVVVLAGTDSCGRCVFASLVVVVVLVERVSMYCQSDGGAGVWCRLRVFVRM